MTCATPTPPTCPRQACRSKACRPALARNAGDSLALLGVRADPCERPHRRSRQKRAVSYPPLTREDGLSARIDFLTERWLDVLLSPEATAADAACGVALESRHPEALDRMAHCGVLM
jgi:hypothetical protein